MKKSSVQRKSPNKCQTTPQRITINRKIIKPLLKSDNLKPQNTKVINQKKSNNSPEKLFFRSDFDSNIINSNNSNSININQKQNQTQNSPGNFYQNIINSPENSNKLGNPNLKMNKYYFTKNQNLSPKTKTPLSSRYGKVNLYQNNSQLGRIFSPLRNEPKTNSKINNYKELAASKSSKNLKLSLELNTMISENEIKICKKLLELLNELNDLRDSLASRKLDVQLKLKLLDKFHDKLYELTMEFLNSDINSKNSMVNFNNSINNIQNYCSSYSNPRYMQNKYSATYSQCQENCNFNCNIYNNYYSNYLNKNIVVDNNICNNKNISINKDSANRSKAKSKPSKKDKDKDNSIKNNESFNLMISNEGKELHKKKISINEENNIIFNNKEDIKSDKESSSRIESQKKIKIQKMKKDLFDKMLSNNQNSNRNIRVNNTNNKNCVNNRKNSNPQVKVNTNNYKHKINRLNNVATISSSKANKIRRLNEKNDIKKEESSNRLCQTTLNNKVSEQGNKDITVNTITNTNIVSNGDKCTNRQIVRFGHNKEHEPLCSNENLNFDKNKDKVNKSIDLLNSTINELKNSNLESQNKINVLNSNLKNYQNEIENKEKINNDLLEQNKTILNELKEKNNQIQNLQNNILKNNSEYTEKIKELNENIDQLNKNNIKLQSEINEKNNSIEDYLDLINKQKEEIEKASLKEAIDSITSKIKSISPLTHKIVCDKTYNNFHWYLLSFKDKKSVDNIQNYQWVESKKIDKEINKYNKFKSEKDIENENLSQIFTEQNKWMKKLEEKDDEIFKLNNEIKINKNLTINSQRYNNFSSFNLFGINEFNNPNISNNVVKDGNNVGKNNKILKELNDAKVKHQIPNKKNSEKSFKIEKIDKFFNEKNDDNGKEEFGNDILEECRDFSFQKNNNISDFFDDLDIPDGGDSSCKEKQLKSLVQLLIYQIENFDDVENTMTDICKMVGYNDNEIKNIYQNKLKNKGIIRNNSKNKKKK